MSFGIFFASRGGVPGYAASSEATEREDLSGVDLF